MGRGTDDNNDNDKIRSKIYKNKYVLVFDNKNKKDEELTLYDIKSKKDLGKYKGIKSESGLDDWLNNVRDILESADATGPMELMKEFKMDLYDKEVFVFTPKGDLYKLPKGATVLDFAFLIHTALGSKCVGAKVNDKNQPIKYVLKSGDTIEVLTSPSQTPKQDWLNIVATSKARVKIKQALNEATYKEAEFGKELLQRRFKNRKIDVDEAIMMRLIKKTGYKTVTDFYYDLSQEKIDVNAVIDSYLDLDRKENEESTESRTAENYRIFLKNLGKRTCW